MPIVAPPPGHPHLIRNALALTGLVLAILLVLAALYFVVPRPFFFTLSSSACSPSSVSLALPTGSQVSFQWNVAVGQTALLTVSGPGGSDLYSSNASAGSGHFTTASAGTFVFTAASCGNTTVFVQGSYVPSL